MIWTKRKFRFIIRFTIQCNCGSAAAYNPRAPANGRRILFRILISVPSFLSMTGGIFEKKQIGDMRLRAGVCISADGCAQSESGFPV